MSFLFKVTVSLLILATIVFLIWNQQQIRKYDAILQPQSSTANSTPSIDENNVSNQELDKDMLKIDSQIKAVDQGSAEVDQSMNDKPINQ